MKKLLALILCLMLPVMALAETAPQEEWVTVDLGDFTMDLRATDAIEIGEKAEGQVLFMAYPWYSQEASSADNINATWTAEVVDFSQLSAEDMSAFADYLVSNLKAEAAAQNIVISNEQVYAAEYDAQSGATIIFFSMDWDYSGLGIDFSVTLYQMQIYVSDETAGTYVFTLTSDSPETITAMLTEYFSKVQFK